MARNPNSTRNRFKPQITVKDEESMLKVREEIFTKLKSEGVGDHSALVQAINSVAIVGTSQRQKRKRSHKKKKIG